MSQSTQPIIVWACRAPAHEHLTWEGADLCAQIYPQLVRLQREAIRAALACLDAFESMRGHSRYPSPVLEENYDHLYVQLRAQYEAAGEPYGHDETAMRRWLREQSEAA